MIAVGPVFGSGGPVIIVILHCHFERGGVTQVVENHVRALRETGQFERIVLVSGERKSGLSEETLNTVEWINIDGFDYDPDGLSDGDLASRQQRMLHELKTQFAYHDLVVDDALLHWHNHSLGKNTAAPGVIRSLAGEGWSILLQVHDFAEDNRPENYERLISAIGAEHKQQVDHYLYPLHEQIHYATLTTSDSFILEALGVDRERIDCLPNSVSVPQGLSLAKEEARHRVVDAMNLPADARWSLYPVRGIRRKNIGELLLLARWGESNRYMGLTLKPVTRMEQRSYERWKCVAAEVSTRTIFDAGESSGLSFLQNLLAADFVVSTSVAEGFGMAFLEPWLLGRGVIARRLNTVTDDFERGGVDLSSFYDSIPIPGNKSWMNECEKEIRDAQRKAWKHLPEAFQPKMLASHDDTAETIDFARLIPQRQIEVLKRMVADRGFENAAREFSDSLVTCMEKGVSDAVLLANADAVRELYGPTRIGDSLVRIYQQLGNDSIVGKHIAGPEAVGRSVDPDAGRQAGIDLISTFRPFFPCRTELL